MECYSHPNVGVLHITSERENEARDVPGNDSPEDFQKFIYELFEKNGVLSDLRAYLRGHIVDVLKSSEIGNVTICQTRFTERLKLPSQALNILIAEYLLNQEFNYSLSVFVSEMPLSNMMFNFSKDLMAVDTHGDTKLLRFTKSDIWNILKFVGVQCDSKYAENLLSMYNSEDKPPLLTCLLKSTVMAIQQEHSVISPQVLSNESAENSDASLDKPTTKRREPQCSRRCSECKANNEKASRIKEKYRSNKKEFAKMFEQLKSVYEKEIEMVRVTEKGKIKKSLEELDTILKKQRQQLESHFQTREQELEQNIEQKKKFLWTLAQSLRDQHSHMSRAMAYVKEEGRRLTKKEEKLKNKFVEAEEILKIKGDEMREDITNEINILESHLNSMKSERDSITKERDELLQLKSAEATEAFKRYDFDNHFATLNRFIKESRSDTKQMTEKGVLTELHDVTSKLNIFLNNHDGRKRDAVSMDTYNRSNGRYLEMNRSCHVVNDLKKNKNINTCCMNVHSSPDLSLNFSRSVTATAISNSSDDALKNIIEKLQEQNEQLRAFSIQQGVHIEQLSLQQTRLHLELESARCAVDTVTAMQRFPTFNMPPLTLPTQTERARSQNASSHQRVGAGEQLSMYGGARRVLLPGDKVPFLGTIHNNVPTSNQWKPLKKFHKADKKQENEDGGSCRNIVTMIAEASERVSPEPVPDDSDLDVNCKIMNNTYHTLGLENTMGPSTSTQWSVRERDSANALQEAKLRLKKLEIEAEAVEKSYLEFRRQTIEKREEHSSCGAIDVQPECKPVRVQADTSLHRRQVIKAEQERHSVHTMTNNRKAIKNDIDKYLKQYNKNDIGNSFFKNKATALKAATPIPEVLTITMREGTRTTFNNKDLVETPLTEFRKYYQPSRDNSIHSKPSVRQTNNTRQDAKPTIVADKHNIGNESTRTQTQHRAKSAVHTEPITTNFDELIVLKPESIDIDSQNTINTKPLVPSKEIEANTNIPTYTPEKKPVLETKSSDEPKNNILVIVERSVDKIDITDDVATKDAMELTIVVSPTAAARPLTANETNVSVKELEKQEICNEIEIVNLPERELNLEEQANINRNDVVEALFDNDNVPENKPEGNSSDDSLNTFLDNFSAVGDNNYPRYVSDSHSPISVATHGEENFWDS